MWVVCFCWLLPLTVEEFKTDASPGVLDWVGLSYTTLCSLVGSLCLHFFRVERLSAHHLLLPVSYRIKLSMNKVCLGYYWNTASLKLYRVWSPSLRMCAGQPGELEPERGSVPSPSGCRSSQGRGQATGATLQASPRMACSPLPTSPSTYRSCVILWKAQRLGKLTLCVEKGVFSF